MRSATLPVERRIASCLRGAKQLPRRPQGIWYAFCYESTEAGVLTLTAEETVYG